MTVVVPPGDRDTAAALVGHLLLGCLAVVAGALHRVRESPDLPAKTRAELLRLADIESERMVEALRILSAESPEAALAFLRRGGGRFR